MIKTASNYFFLGLLMLLIGCGAAPEPSAEREFSLDPASIETTPLPTPTEILSLEESYPIPTSTVEVQEAYPASSNEVTNEVAYPVEDELTEEDAVTNGNSSAADADVMFVRVVETAPETYTFHVTVAHPDTGWEDYADGWNVVIPDGSVLVVNDTDPFTRLLAHPHETEQPFTRSQSNIVIPSSITQVTVQAHDLVDGFGGAEVVVDLTLNEGLNFTVER